MANYHVSLSGNDAHPGTTLQPLRTIQAAANLAQPGDTVTVHAGIYRERIDPPRGGTSDDARILYEAAPGEEVTITGAEPIQGWEPFQDQVWRVRVPNSLFGSFNPYADRLRGHWFKDRNRQQHTGEVYVNGHWLMEAKSLDDLLAPRPLGSLPLWFGEVKEETTTLWAEFPGLDPNATLVEMNVRQTVFYPSRTGINYITVRGFNLRQAATPWAPPTTEQIGLIGTNWGKGWIIENNTVSYSKCSGITLGKYADPEDFGEKPIVEFTQAEDTYHGTIRRALAHGWSRETTGHHIVRNNRVSHCEMAGICGSLGAIFCEVTDNVVHDIHTHQLFLGWEMAGIKFHGAIDTLIARNHIYRCNRGLWLDWMSQGTRVTANLFHHNGPDPDLFIEVNHGPCSVDHNLFLSAYSVQDVSEGTLFAHNLIAGRVLQHAELGRTTPYHKAHSTEVVEFLNIQGGDNRFIHNLFLPSVDLTKYGEEKTRPSLMKMNVFFGVARPSPADTSAVRIEAEEIRCSILMEGESAILSHTLPVLPSQPTEPITEGALGEAAVSGLPYEDYNGEPLRLEQDYFGKPHQAAHPQAGPFASFPQGPIQVWPR